MNKLILVLLLTTLSFSAFAQNHDADSIYVMEHYTKTESSIPMRDGEKLYTAVYAPKDYKKEKHPILINRTPYSIAPYGSAFRPFWYTYWMNYLKEGYIIVLQDVRGRYMSEGEFEDVRPYIEHKNKKETDEASDTYDTIDWLLKNVKGNNGKVGVFGISYPGFYSTEAALCGHPALKAVSPQAPVTDWFMGDDFHHNGAFMEMDAFNFYNFFGKPRRKPTTINATEFTYPNKDNYKFYLDAGTLQNIARLIGDSVKFWKEIYDHPNYDDFWKSRNTRNYVDHIPGHTATLVVGGLFDAEDCFGAWNLYKAIEKAKVNNNKLVMGPWFHGGWSRSAGDYMGNVRFGSKTAEWYQQHIEIPYFDYYLLGKGDINKIKEANIFFSGANEWRTFDTWPPKEVTNEPLYLKMDGSLSYIAPQTPDAKSYKQYTSDPTHPVPYTEDVHFKRTREYMTDDQRFASRRPDVLTYQTDTLTNDVTLAGPVIADLYTAISTTDADFVVKIIDVFPDNFTYDETIYGKGNGKDYPMGGYEMLVRGEVMRGRYRQSFTTPEAFIPNKVTEVKYKMPDVAHTFKKGHRIMVQIQSSWFPLVDRNPQQFVDIYTCTEADFIPSNVQIFSGREHASNIILPVLR